MRRDLREALRELAIFVSVMTIEHVAIRGSESPASIHVDGSGRFAAFPGAGDTMLRLPVGEAIAFPGLINSHDHLDFNAFPRLGNHRYEHYVPWGNDIHATHADVIAEVLRIPKPLQVQWSLYKNLLNGITTVVQHGPRFGIQDGPIDVFEDCISIHSVQLERNWKLRLNKPRLRNRPVVIHIGEGTNCDARDEIDQLLRWNLLRRRLIGVHGIAMLPAQARRFDALVWCPDSNYFLYGATADIRALQSHVPILFGTDSMLTSGWNLWQQLRLAADRGGASPAQLYDMLSTSPAEVWGMSRKGSLAPGTQADLVVARQKHDRFLDSFMALEPADLLLTMVRGKIKMIDERLVSQMDPDTLRMEEYAPIRIGDSRKYVYGDLPALIGAIRQHYPAFSITDPPVFPAP